MNALPATMLDSVGEDSVKIAFYEFQRSLMDGHALARYLIMLAPCIQRVDRGLFQSGGHPGCPALFRPELPDPQFGGEQ